MRHLAVLTQLFLHRMVKHFDHDAVCWPSVKQSAIKPTLMQIPDL